jgi:hypothetical protein
MSALPAGLLLCFGAHARFIKIFLFFAPLCSHLCVFAFFFLVWLCAAEYFSVNSGNIASSMKTGGIHLCNEHNTQKQELGK